VQALALVSSGVVRVFKTGRTGREITLYRIGAGETCILSVNAILTRQPVPAAATAEQRVEAVMIPADALREWVQQQELWREFVFELISQRLLRVLNLVEDVVFRRMDARIATLLLDRGRARNPMRITHQEIAAELGTSGASTPIERVPSGYRPTTVLTLSALRFKFCRQDPPSKVSRDAVVVRSKLPVPYQVTWEPRGGYTRLYGSVTGADMRGNIEEVCRNARFQEQRYHILDFSDATEFTATEREMLVNCGVLVGAAFVNHQVMLAAVVTRENVRATLERLHALGVSPYEAKMFASTAEARKWIEQSGFTSGRYSVA